MSERLFGERSFEESLVELEKMVRELEDGRLGLDEALARYEKGVGLIKDCYQHLQKAEQKILQLVGSGEGRAVLQTFRHEATAGEGPPRKGRANGHL